MKLRLLRCQGSLLLFIECVHLLLRILLLRITFETAHRWLSAIRCHHFALTPQLSADGTLHRIFIDYYLLHEYLVAIFVHHGILGFRVVLEVVLEDEVVEVLDAVEFGGKAAGGYGGVSRALG